MIKMADRVKGPGEGVVLAIVFLVIAVLIVSYTG